MVAPPKFSDIFGDKPSDCSIQYLHTRCKIQFAADPVNIPAPQLVDLGISTTNKLPRSHTTKTPQDGAITTISGGRFVVAKEYAAALEEKSHAQAERIIELEARVDGQTALTDATDYAEKYVTMGVSKKDLNDLRVIMKQLVDSITGQAATLEALSTKTNSGGGGSGGGKNTDKKNCGQACTCARTPRGKYIIRKATA